jgi:hypothetical protein
MSIHRGRPCVCAKYLDIQLTGKLRLHTALVLVLLAGVAIAAAQNAAPARESPSDAWWTGPLLAPNAATVPAGHYYFEPYVYDEMPYAALDSRGHTHPIPYGNHFGSLAYINYGLTDRLTVGMLPSIGHDRPADGGARSGVGVGDLTLQAQYRLTPIAPYSRVPIASINVQETVPVGRYDHLGNPSDGFGSGAYATTLSTYFMSYFWLPNGRILRARLDLSYAISSEVSVGDQSVYGTPIGFSGHASPGNSAYGDLAFEYSMTRNWVLACDFWFQENGHTRVVGAVSQPDGRIADFQSLSAVGRELYVAPAVEYNWSARLGVIFGIRVVSAGSNETGTVTPVAAISYFH